jgi:hypothetical protein
MWCGGRQSWQKILLLDKHAISGSKSRFLESTAPIT